MPSQLEKLRKQKAEFLEALRLAGKEAVQSLPNMSERDVAWIQREAEKLLAAWGPRMENGINPDAIPAVWLYALAAMRKCHELGMKSKWYIMPSGLF